MAAPEYEGRSGRVWAVRRILHRPGHLRPTAGRAQTPHNVELVRDRDEEVHGALRRFRDRGERGAALAFLTASAPYTPVVLDLIDDPRLPPAIVTSWAPGRSQRFLDQLSRYDDLADRLERGRRFSPAQALNVVVSLGQALDAAAEVGFTPIELSPDHLIYNSGSIRLVGIGRHLYRPAVGEIPNPRGMSLPTALLLGDDYPGRPANQHVWRHAQRRALLRLAGWMTCGLPPAAWGRTGADPDADLLAYLTYAGFSGVPELRLGSLAADLARAAVREEQHAAMRLLRHAKAVVLYDDEAGRETRESLADWGASLVGRVLQATVLEVTDSGLRTRVATHGTDDWHVWVRWDQTPPAAARRPRGRVNLRDHYRVGATVNLRIDEVTPRPRDYPRARARVVPEPGSWARARRQRARVDVNPEAVRLGLMVEHGPDVVAIAGFAERAWTRPLASALSGAGWILVEPRQLAPAVRRLATVNGDARFVVAGRVPAALESVLRRVRAEHVVPGAADPPRIAGRPATELPYLRDRDLDEFAEQMLGAEGGRALRRRSFTAGWAIAWDCAAHRSVRKRASTATGARELRNSLDFLTQQFGTHTELLLRVRILLNSPAFRHSGNEQLRANVEHAALILRGLPAHGKLRRDLISVLLSRTTEDLYDVVAKRILPVAPRLAAHYDPALELGGRPVQENLLDRPGVERVGLFGRLLTALPGRDPAELAAAVCALEDRLVTALANIPAPSLQHLVGRLRSRELFQALLPFVDSDDLDLLNQYTPSSWEVLLDGLRAPEHLATLGLGWALLVDRDPQRHVDPRSLLELAAATGREGRYVVRSVLAAPDGTWPLLDAFPRLAAAWLREFNDLDFADVAAVYPDAERLLDRLGARTLRNGFVCGLDREQLIALCDFAVAIGVSESEIVDAHLRVMWTPTARAALTSVAGTQWLRQQVAAGTDLVHAMRALVERPQSLRTWAVDGAGLRRRILTDVLAAPPKALGLTAAEQRSLIAGLAARPGLAQLASRVVLARQRLALLRVVLARPADEPLDASLWQHAQELLTDPDPGACLDLMRRHQLTLAQARTARRLGLTETGCRLLRALGPLADGRSDAELVALATVARAHGIPCALTTAVVEQTLTGAIAVVAGWGPVWLPMLAGPHGSVVRDALAGATAPATEVTWLAPWLAAAGRLGIAALARHGQRFVDVACALRPPTADVLLLSALLDGDGWPVQRMYRCVVANGLPHCTWEQVAQWMSEGRPDDDILLALWDRSSRHLAARSGLADASQPDESGPRQPSGWEIVPDAQC